MRTIYSIRALRSVATVTVVVAHAFSSSGNATGVPSLINVTLGCQVAVDVFFVISGFMMATIIGHDRPRASTFFWNRFSRIFPIYWIATASLAAVLLLLRGDEQIDVAHLAMSLVLWPHFGPDGTLGPFLNVAWTLLLEVPFYALLSLCLCFRRDALTTCAWALVGIVACGQLLRLLQDVHIIENPRRFAFLFFTSPLTAEFLAGLLIARLTLAARVTRPVGAAMIVAGLMIVAASWIAVDLHRLGAWTRLLFCGVPACLFLVGIQAFEDAGIFRRRAVEVLDGASYSVYLFHMPVLMIIVSGFAWVGGSSTTLLILISVPLAVAAGCLIHARVERPLVLIVRALSKSPKAGRPYVGPVVDGTA